MAENKTQKTTASVSDFLTAVSDETKRQDCFTLLELMRQASGSEPVIWGATIVGFGDLRYKSPATGREGDWFKVGFSPRKQNLTLYILGGFSQQGDLLGQLGKHKTSVGCLYINKLSDINIDILKQIIARSLA